MLPPHHPHFGIGQKLHRMRNLETHDREEQAESPQERIEALEAEVDRLRRKIRDFLLAIRWREAKHEGKMREMQSKGSDEMHSRLREGRYEGVHSVKSLAEVYFPDLLEEMGALDEAEDGDQ